MGFPLSLREIEEPPFETGVLVRHETIRRWCDKFGAGFAHCVKAACRGRTAAHSGVGPKVHDSNVSR
jgi:putative transposase